MSAVYSNKFTLELNDVARIVFVDERAPKAKGWPMASVTAAEVILTHNNLKALYELIGNGLKKLEK